MPDWETDIQDGMEACGHIGSTAGWLKLSTALTSDRTSAYTSAKGSIVFFDVRAAHVLTQMHCRTHATVSHAPELPTCDHLAAVGWLIANKEDMWG